MSITCSYFNLQKYGAEEPNARAADFLGSGVVDPSTDFDLVFPSTPDMTVTIGIGTAWTGGYRICEEGSETLTFSDADTTNPRIDLIQVGAVGSDGSGYGDITIVEGTAAAIPSQPDADGNSVALYAVYIAANATSVSDSDFSDLRTRVTFFGYDVVTEFEDLVAHIANMNNPHDVTAAQIGAATATAFEAHQSATPIDHPDSSVTTAKIAAAAVTDAKIGNRTIDDTLIAVDASNTLTNLLGMIGYMLKSITGESVWASTPDTTLAAVSLSANPTGTILAYSGSSAPSGYLLCDGSVVSRTSYAALYAVIGTIYGTGDGSTTFNLPDCADKFILGLGSTYATLAATGGDSTHTLTTDEMPAHTHTVTAEIKKGDNSSEVYGWSEDPIDCGSTSITSDSTGGDGAHNNMPPYIVLNYIIKY